MAKEQLIYQENKILRFLSWSILVFICFQAILDNYFLYTDAAPRIAGMTIPTLVRYFFVLASFALIMTQAGYLKKLRFLFVYFTLVIGYFFAHVWANRQFQSLLNTDPYSATGELTYILRLLMPIIFFFIVYQLKFSKQALTRSVQFVFALTIVILLLSNLSLISLASYTNKTIEGNIFSWFSEDLLSYSKIASKGWFNFANQLSAYLIMFLPIIIYSAIKQRSRFALIFLFLAWPAMLMIGTRVAAYGILLALFVTLGLGIFFMFREETVGHKPYYLFVILLVAVGFVATLKILPYAPASLRANISESLIEEEEERLGYNSNKKTETSSTKTPLQTTKPQTDTVPEERWVKAGKYILAGDLQSLQAEFSKEEKTRILRHRLPNSLIYSYFYKESYPYENDPDFWIDSLFLPPENQKDNRYVEVAMIRRIKEINNRSTDTWFGLGNSRIQGVYNIERDFINQYYSMGILGVLLFFMIYPLWSIIGGIWILQSFIKRFRLFYICCLASISLPVLISVGSGNLIDSLLITLTLAFIAGISLSLMRQDSQKTSNQDTQDSAQLDQSLLLDS